MKQKAKPVEPNKEIKVEDASDDDDDEPGEEVRKILLMKNVILTRYLHFMI